MHDLIIRDIDGEPRMRDLDIGLALGFDRPRDIRKLIERHMDAILSFGICATVAQIHDGAGRPTAEYWLNEEQALFLCTRSEAPGAVALTRQMVMVFAAWRGGRLPDAPRTPLPDLPPDAATWARLIREARLLFGRDRARWLWAQSPLPQPPAWLPGGARPADDTGHVLEFIAECCDVTGLRRDFTTSRALIDGFDGWAMPRGVVLGERRLSMLLRDISGGWCCPVTGAGFTAARRATTGYAGILLRGASGPGPVLP